MDERKGKHFVRIITKHKKTIFPIVLRKYFTQTNYFTQNTQTIDIYMPKGMMKYSLCLYVFIDLQNMLEPLQYPGTCIKEVLQFCKLYQGNYSFRTYVIGIKHIFPKQKKEVKTSYVTS